MYNLLNLHYLLSLTLLHYVIANFKVILCVIFNIFTLTWRLIKLYLS